MRLRERDGDCSEGQHGASPREHSGRRGRRERGSAPGLAESEYQLVPRA